MPAYDFSLNPPAPIADVVVAHPTSGVSSVMRGKLDCGADITVIPEDLTTQLGIAPKSHTWTKGYDGTYSLQKMSIRPKTELARSAAYGLVEPLTAREVEILRLIVAGMRNQEIADHLFISLHTVKRHIANAYGKLGVTHRTGAVARVNELKLL